MATSNHAEVTGRKQRCLSENETGGPRIKRAPQTNENPDSGQGRFLLRRGTEVLDVAKGNLLLSDRKSALELGYTRLEGVQLPQDEVCGRLPDKAHERLRHAGRSSPQQRLQRPLQSPSALPA